MGKNQTSRPLPLEHLQDPRKLPFVFGRSRGELPHLYKPGCTYFVTFCLFDKRRRRPSPSPSREPYQTLTPEIVARKSEPPDGPSTLLLALPRIARVVEEALLFFQGDRYGLHSWCIMPNHVHCLVTPYGRFDLTTILHSWKSYSARTINLTLHRSGPVWQRETFHHMVRTADWFEYFLRYIEHNPVNAGLCVNPHDWAFSSARYRTPS